MTRDHCPDPADPDRPVDLTPVVQALFPPGVAAAMADPAGEYPLMPPEPESLAAAPDADAVTPARLRAFSAGRAAARAAMLALGLPPAPVPRGADRAPRWPEGLVGSIAHGPHQSVAVLGRRRDFLGLGIDLAPDLPLPEEQGLAVLTPQEHGWLDEQPAAERAWHERLIFCAKEAAFKCQYGITGQLLGYQAFSVLPALDQGGFSVRFRLNAGPFMRGDRLEGRFARTAGQIVAGIALSVREEWLGAARF